MRLILAHCSGKSPTYIDTIAAGLSYSKESVESPYIYHYDALDEIKLGHLFAQAIMDYKIIE